MTVAAKAAVVFDMDGVLLDSEPLHHIVVNDLLAEDGVSLDSEQYKAYLGTTLECTWQDIIHRYSLPRDIGHYVGRYDDAIIESYRRHSVPAPGAVALVAGLRARGLKLAVASSSRTAWVEMALEALGVRHQFDAVVTGDMVTQSKPDPEIYLLAAERLGVDPARCLAIEDAPKGVISARTAGMTVVGVRTEYTAHLTLEGADTVLDDLTQFDYDMLDPHPPTPSPAAAGEGETQGG
ncbi:MAG: HAD family phosphatase [Chloroflexi bacterium]|nr:HAD family phosphatase [Chloroflexota bacterium]